MLIQAKDCRNKLFLRTIPHDKPGWYKWFAPLASVMALLDSKYLCGSFSERLLPLLSSIDFKGETFYCIYIGLAVKESVQARLDWHINQKHALTAVKRGGFLSTFRRTLSALVSGDQTDGEATNKIIDTFLVDYYVKDFAIKSEEARIAIGAIEREEINLAFSPLNIKDNKRVEAAEFIKELKKARKNAMPTF